ncbi:unnamed protein product [Scytosiphon promiscuus]
MEAPRPNHYDPLEGDMKAMKEGISVNQSYPGINAASHLGQYRNKDPAAVASSKLQGYRASTEAMMSHNRRTERFLSPASAQQPASKLQRPQVYCASVSTTVETENNTPSFPGTAAEVTAGNGEGDAYTDVRDMVDGSLEGRESRDETIERLTKVIRTRNATVKTLKAEVDRYAALASSFGVSAVDISNKTATSNQRVTNLADDLAMERSMHEKATKSLEQKTREVEQQSLRLREMEEASAAAHQANLELSGRMEEMNRLSQEQEQQRAEEAAAAAAAAAAVEPGARNGGGGDEVQNKELQEEVDKLTRIVEMKAKQLQAVQERASKTSTELQYYKGQARSGRFKSLLLRLWWLLRAIGYVGFLLFAYVAVSEDALRSRGVDVYRLAH